MRPHYHRTFKKAYRKAPIRIRDAFDIRLTLFLREPSHPLLNLHSLTGDRAGQWSINVGGDWRAIFIYTDEQTVIFIDFDTHSNLYG